MSPNVLERMRAVDAALKAKDAEPAPSGNIAPRPPGAVIEAINSGKVVLVAL